MAKPEPVKGLFIAATDTGVGKTFVGCALAAWLRAKNISVGVMKPVETGGVWRSVNGKRRLVGEDASALAQSAQCEAPMEQINPYCFKEPIAPETAAERAGAVIEWPTIHRAYRALCRRSSVILVEGAGGLWVPLNRRLVMFDLARRFRLPVLLVARPGLGTINHTMLSLELLRREHVSIAGVVFNRSAPPADRWSRLSERENPGVIRRYAGVPFLGCLPYVGGDVRLRNPAAWLERHMDVTRLKILDAVST